jgi:WD40 repeat protein
VRDGSISQTLQGTAERVHNLAFSPDGRMLVSLSVYGEIQSWDLADGSLVYSQPGVGDPDIYAGNLVFSADGSLLAVANAGKNIQILDPDDGSLVRTLVGHEQTVGTIAFIQGEKTLLSHARYWAVNWWDASTGDLLYTLDGTDFYWPLFTFSPDGKIPIRMNESIQIRDGSNGSLISQIEDFSPSYWKFNPSPDGSHLAAWNSINRLDLLDLESGGVKQTAAPDLENALTRLNQCTHSPDGAWLVCSFSDGSLQVWDVQGWGKLLDIESGSEEISNCVFSPDETRITCGDDLGLLRAWQSQDGQLLRTIEAHSDEIGMLLTAPDGNYLASASRSTIRLWEPETLEMILEIEETDWVNCLAISPDSSTLATGREDYLVNLWNITDGTLLRTLEGHTDEIFSLAFSADGGLIASGDYEGMIYLWGFPDGALLSHFPAHHGTVTSLAFTPDGTSLVSAGSDGTLRVWDLPTQK